MINARRYTGQFAVISGAAAGIGAATVARFIAEGATVIGVDVDDPSLKTLTEQYSNSFIPVVGDVSDESTWVSVSDRVGDAGVISLVCNAYSIARQRIGEIDFDAWDRQWAVNVTGAVRAVRVCLDAIRRAQGSVTLISSVHVTRSAAGHAGYASSKAALEGLARQLAIELAPDVRVNTVRVGPVDTHAWQGQPDGAKERSAARTLLQRLGAPQDIASTVNFLASNEASWITGATLVVDGGRELHSGTLAL
ncbi:MAG: hypothetical protein B5766_07990 [Candidatus Lumbricidophila eiseniae]|uniref:Short-chain dehydrogenase n=1 Tax=Candidatus Lumbricidiphila eiseniae TaxID=1969409 RepID=A0A2A6FQV1_9MICO|nr:MAG: hypothetical protein B5766_07990 [Candidatus Lumbricidophila eiseniae]